MAESGDFIRQVAVLFMATQAAREAAKRESEWFWYGYLAELQKQLADELRREQRAVAADQMTFDVRARTRDIGE